MRKKEVLEQLDSLIEISNWKKDAAALEIAKKSVNKEYRFQFLYSVILMIITFIVFGSFVGMTYFMYYR